MTPDADAASAAVRDRHVVLIGLMGAGKTTVGRRLAQRLGRPFVDTDDLVEETAGRTIAQIFADDGEPAFRALERAAVADACASPTPLVIAVGGGAVVDAENRRVIDAAGIVVWLRACAAQLAARVGDGAGRPLLAGVDGTAEALERLASLREPSYEAVADVAIDTDALDPDRVADRVLEEVAACAA